MVGTYLFSFLDKTITQLRDFLYKALSALDGHLKLQYQSSYSIISSSRIVFLAWLYLIISQ